ncbi:MAG: probable sulfite oxidase, partial [uncultured Corynebacteriales bacterium]
TVGAGATPATGDAAPATGGATLLAGNAAPVAEDTEPEPDRPDDAPPGPVVRRVPGATRAGLRDELVRVDRKAGGVDRRGFLVRGATVGAVAALAGVAGRKLQGVRFDAAESRAAVRLPAPASPAPALPAASRLDVPGITPYVTPNRSFYRVDTALVVPQVPTETWGLRVHGMVDRELNLSWDDLLARDLIERDITMTCVSNEVGGTLAGTARWLGAPLRALLEEAGVRPGADQIVGTSSDGMTIGTPTAVVLDGRDAMLAVGMNGEPLPLEHGFPVRMIVPGLYGYVSGIKWLVDLELTTFDAVDPYWVQRGWVQKAPIKTASRIDTPRPLEDRKAGKVAVAGVAWAQHRGVAAVEVRVDDGGWQRARLAAEPSTDLWVQWVWEWDAEPGPHTLTVRATDKDGRTQPEERVAPFPSGSTGWHSVVVSIS